MNRLALSLVAVVAVVVTACSGTAASPSPAGGGANPPGSGATTKPAGAGTGGDPGAQIDSCAILEDAEIKAATGTDVEKRTASTLTQVFPSVCDIDLADGGQLTVSILPSGGRKMYERSFEPFIGTEVLDEAVTGLGDKAGRSGDDELMVLSGDVLYDVLYIKASLGPDDKLPTVRYIAETVLAKLPCAAAGCPGFSMPPPPSQPAGQTVDACALLTPEEVTAATSFPTIAGEPEPGSGGSGCKWILGTGSAIVPHTITVQVTPTGGKARFDLLSQGWPPIPGLGDGAVLAGGNTAGSLYAVSGDRLLTVVYSLPIDIPDATPLLVPLAKQALSRL